MIFQKGSGTLSIPKCPWEIYDGRADQVVNAILKSLEPYDHFPRVKSGQNVNVPPATTVPYIS